jgi:carbon storage regulator
MLMLTRRVGETILIGKDIAITVVGIRGNQVRFSLKAPREIQIDREEKRLMDGIEKDLGQTRPAKTTVESESRRRRE